MSPKATVRGVVSEYQRSVQHAHAGPWNRVVLLALKCPITVAERGRNMTVAASVGPREDDIHRAVIPKISRSQRRCLHGGGESGERRFDSRLLEGSIAISREH
jgi:hypothetical protein